MRQNPFRVALSIEKDPQAHTTLELRAFFREFRDKRVPAAYYRFMRGEITRQELFAAYPREALAASRGAWRAELGRAPVSDVRHRIKKALTDRGQHWVLIGGPPCQAYSVV